MSGVFISYSRKDLKTAEAFEKALKSAGIRVWRDQESIYAGEKWPKAIGMAIADNQLLLLLWSAQASRSHYVEFEWNTALALQKTILPVFVENIRLPPALSAINGLSAADLTSNTNKIKEQLARRADKADNDEEVLDALSQITSTDPASVLNEAKAVFRQKKWTVQGNVYQVSGGDINIHNNETSLPWYRSGPLAILVLFAVAVITYFFMAGPLDALFGSGRSESLQLTVYVHGPDSRQEVVLENTGKLIVDLDNDRRRAIIGENGRTNFGEIPPHFREAAVGIGLEAPGYELINPQQEYVINGKPIYLAVRKDDSLGRIKGMVKNRNGSVFLADALVLIDSDTSIYTDELGVFSIVLPPHLQVRDEKTPYKLTVQKEGYQVASEYYYPLSGDIEIRLNQ